MVIWCSVDDRDGDEGDILIGGWDMVMVIWCCCR